METHIAGCLRLYILKFQGIFESIGRVDFIRGTAENRRILVGDDGFNPIPPHAP